MSKKIKAKCFFQQHLATNAKGFLIPCCWCSPRNDNDLNFKKLIMDEFHLDKVENINEVIYSKEWQEFKNNLFESNIEKLPKVCLEKCSVNDDLNNSINRKDFYFEDNNITKKIR